jgi:hypothetical protein
VPIKVKANQLFEMAGAYMYDFQNFDHEIFLGDFLIRK